jgi:8-oxo-dGTP pyrophosphatase MutT (NUDIX family)
MAVQPRLASTIMLLRDTEAGTGEEQGKGIEVFMVRRVIQSDFMPDVFVFPGGSASAGDRIAEQTEGICQSVAPTQSDPDGHTALGSGLRAAAIREVFEEAGVLLALRKGQILSITESDIPRFAAYRKEFQMRQGSLVEMARAEKLTLATNQLRYFAHWITPEGMPKRFDTYFFLATAPAEQQAAHDRLETSDGVWISPQEALEKSERGEFPLVFATIHQLRDLAAFSSVRQALTYSETHAVPTRMPILTLEQGEARVYFQDDKENAWIVPDNIKPQS